MKTSYFNNKKINNEKYIPIRISRGYPRWELHYEIKGKIAELMPLRNMLTGINQEIYIKKYRILLNSVGVQVLQQIFKGFKKNGKTIILLCFENISEDREWCHRRIFADWWKEKTGKEIKEL